MKTTIKLSLLLFLALLNVNCNNKKASKTITEFGEINVIAPKEFKEKSINKTIIDIRTPNEFLEGHIDGAVNINYFDKNFLDEISKLDKTKPIFMYCRSGNRTSSASKKISKLGFEQVYDLQGGILNWAKTNHEIVK
ncbi:rhodanese-like domain-containing protein [uncultured Lutibacter sp.]|uniref:rhodanese-like domain-containing protein n=1 Tax=uncultured Lutibacter sp. TaxID=437739 RepID=UPI00263A1BCD|nr:rhodanese-like domain-containing protein [uncultured Lutibacter sp.]